MQIVQAFFMNLLVPPGSRFSSAADKKGPFSSTLCKRERNIEREGGRERERERERERQRERELTKERKGKKNLERIRKRAIGIPCGIPCDQQ